MRRVFRCLHGRGITTTLASFGVLAGLTLAGLASPETLPLRVRVSDRAPDVVLPSGEGRTVRLSDFAGHNILINFYRGHW